MSPAGRQQTLSAAPVAHLISDPYPTRTGKYRAAVLPSANKRFHVVSCLGSLQHFLDVREALREMSRVARDDAVLLFLVPNAGFLSRRMALYRGTAQVAAREEVLDLPEWRRLFES